MRCRTVIASVLIALLLSRVATIFQTLDILKTVEPTPHGCRHIGGFPVDGFEDIVLVDPTTAVSCAGDLYHIFANTSYKLPASSRGSHCVLLRSNPADSPDSQFACGVEITPLRIDGLPFQSHPTPVAAGGTPPRLLHLHGLAVHRDAASGRVFIFALSHAYAWGGETVEVFELLLPPADAPSLRHQRTIQAPPGVFGVNNDLAVVSASFPAGGGVGAGELLVSWYLEFPDSPQGRGHEWWKEAALYARVFAGRFNTDVVRCVFAATSPAMSCSPVLRGLGMANGLTLVPLPLGGGGAASVAVVSDVLRHELVVFQPPPAGGAGEAAPHRLALPHALDNVELDIARPPACAAGAAGKVECTFRVYGGVIGVLGAAAKIDKPGGGAALSPGGALEVEVRVTLTHDGALAGAAVAGAHTMVMTAGDGRQFHGIASGVAVGGGVVVLGSYKSQGLVVCPPLDGPPCFDGTPVK